MASDNEKRAAELGISLKDYKASSEYRMHKDNKDKSKTATKKIEHYYDDKADNAKDKSKVDIRRLKEDLQSILQEAGIAKTRAIEDYTNSVHDIEANKHLDNSNLADYVKTNKGRTQEDLDTSLAKETRRFSLEQDKINNDLADRGMTFSDRKDEKVAQESSAQNAADINTEAERSFQDIARYEAAKTAELNLKYDTATRDATLGKQRTLEDIANEKKSAVRRNSRAIEDVKSNLSDTLNDISYGRDTDVATTKQLFQSDLIDQTDRQNRINVLGY